ncbi:hypothetical protein [Rhizobium leguminosarum]|uniref:hypothetical protein n=1 Tax=Rhizobium leguminosarum TaxID=384 RepID=UPI0013B854E8|nr:hypothetical protein [Rhizobium leguminosarum]NEI60909.1 hypothetical protein [Rhizobium leguminosarum]
MAASGKEAASGIAAVGQAATSTATKVSQASDGVERLKRQFVTGYAASVDFDRGLKTVGSGLDRGKISSEQAAIAIENLSRKYAVSADASHSAARGNVALAQAIETANTRIRSQGVVVDLLADSYRRMAADARAAFAADQAQASINRQLGVGAAQGGSASASASAFEEQLSRQEEIARLRSLQQGATFTSDLNSRLGVGGNGTSARDSAAVFEESAREMERYAQRGAALRAQLDPIGASQARLNAELAEYQDLARRAELSTTELAQAQAMARARHDQLVSSLDGSRQNRGIGQGSTMVAYQAQDIATQAFGGASIGTIALQQGPQLAMALGENGAAAGVRTLGAGLLALASPTNLVAIALTAAAAGALQFGAKLYGSATETKKLSDLLTMQEQVLRRIAAAYGGVAEEAAKASSESKLFLNAQGQLNAGQLKVAATAEAGTFFSSDKVGGRTRAGFVANQREFQDALVTLRNDAAKGKADFDAFYAAIAAKVAIDPSLAEAGNKIIVESEKFKQATDLLKEYQRVRDALFNDRGPTGTLLSQGTTNREDMGNLAIFESQQRVAMERSQKAYDAQLAGLNAKSPAEKAAAARASAAAEYNNDESPAQRNMRISQAGSLAQAQAERALSEAQKDRATSLGKIVSDQQLEMTLIGKTAGEAAALRKEYELTSALRIEAAKNGVDVDQSELDLIRQKAQELGKLTDAYNRAKLSGDLQFEREQLFRSSGDQQIASRQRGAGLPVDLNSADAQMMRQNAQISATKEAVSGFVTDFRQQLVSNGGKIGEAAGKALLNSFLNAMTKAGDQALQRVLDIIFSKLFSGTGTSGAGGLAGAGVGVAGSVLGAANDNIGRAPVMPVTRAPLGDIASYITKAATQRGIDPNTALKVARSEGGLDSWNLQSGYIKNGVREPSFGPYQLYTNGGLGNQFMAKTGLDPRLAANGPAGVDFALDHAAKNGWGSWYGAAKVGVGKWDGIGTGGNVGGAADAVNKLANSAGAATKGLDTLGGGLGKIGSALSGTSFPAAPAASGGGGGGLFSWLSGLFGGFKPIGAQATLAASGRITGLFADGTESAPGGLAIVGERGRELVNLPRGSQVVPNHRTESMLAAANGNSAGANRGAIPLHVVIQGANGDEHVRKLVEQGVSSGIDAYNKEMERSGFGSQQQHFVSRRA